MKETNSCIILYIWFFWAMIENLKWEKNTTVIWWLVRRVMSTPDTIHECIHIRKLTKRATFSRLLIYCCLFDLHYAFFIYRRLHNNIFHLKKKKNGSAINKTTREKNGWLSCASEDISTIHWIHYNLGPGKYSAQRMPMHIIHLFDCVIVWVGKLNK